MRSLPADFAKPARWPVVSLWLIAAVAASGAAWQGTLAAVAWRHLDDEKAKTQILSQQIELARATFAARAASAAAPGPLAADAKHMIALASFDAEGILRSIESVQVQGAKVSQLDIDTDSRRVEIQLDITSADVATTYVQDLNAGNDHPIWVLSRVQSQGTAQSASIRARMP